MLQEEVVQLPGYFFPTPCTITLAGPSGSGKTTLLLDGIIRYRRDLFGPETVDPVLYFYGEDQAAFDRVRATDSLVRFYRGLPTREEFDGMLDEMEGRHFLVILDDLMDEMSRSQFGQDIFTKLSHHRYVTPKIDLYFYSNTDKNRCIARINLRKITLSVDILRPHPFSAENGNKWLKVTTL